MTSSHKRRLPFSQGRDYIMLQEERCYWGPNIEGDNDITVRRNDGNELAFNGSGISETLHYYNNNKDLPIYSHGTPHVKEIFKICLQEDVPSWMMVKVKPTCIASPGTFILNQSELNLKHPYDLKADDTPGAYIKKEQTRFYEVKKEKDYIEISSHVQVTKNTSGKVIDGTLNVRAGRAKWLKRQAKMDDVYAVIRKRAVLKPTIESQGTSFVRYIIFIMPLKEYNENYHDLRNKGWYKLECSNMIVSYYFESEKKKESVPRPSHGGTKNGPKSEKSYFCAGDLGHTRHRLETTERMISKTKHAAPTMVTTPLTIDQYSDERTLYCTPSNGKHVFNHTQNNGTARQDGLGDISILMLEMSRDGPRNATDVQDENQAFIQELLVRHGGKINVVGFLQQTVKDVARFCCGKGSFVTSLKVDIDVNVAEYYLTQTAFRYLAVRKRTDGQPPWFPGPVMTHSSKGIDDFAVFWQVCKRGNKDLGMLKVFEAVKDEALIQGLSQETSYTAIILKDHNGLSSAELPFLKEKDAVDEIWSENEKTYCDSPSLSGCFQALKDRSLRMYGEVVKAIYDQGPYSLCEEFSNFKVSYDTWMKWTREQRVSHIDSFFSYVPEKWNE